MGYTLVPGPSRQANTQPIKVRQAVEALATRYTSTLVVVGQMGTNGDFFGSRKTRL